MARWVYFNGQNIWFLGLVMVLLAAKDVPLRRSLQAFLGCGVPTLALVEVLHFAGIIAPDALSERSGSYRLMFGYGHPNTFGGIVFGLVLAWVLLRQAKITWAEIAAVAGVGLFLCKGPASRSPALCAFLLAVLLVLRQIGGRAQRAQAHRRAVRRHGAGGGGHQLYFAAVRGKNWSLGRTRSAPRGWQSWTAC